MQFWKLSPSGNPTILIPAEQVAPDLRAEVAAAVLSLEHLGADQVGFYSLPAGDQPARLDMMGGEFCLNATRALAFLLTHLGLASAPQTRISVSGLTQPALCAVADDEASTALDFTLPPRIQALGADIWLIRLPGICHIVHLQSQPPADAAAYCRATLALHDLEDEDAVGFMWLDEKKLELTPLVWVRQTASLVRESACGSGSLACALLLHQRHGMTNFQLLQPSGRKLSVEFEELAPGHRVWVGGPVKLVAAGELFV